MFESSVAVAYTMAIRNLAGGSCCYRFSQEQKERERERESPERESPERESPERESRERVQRERVQREREVAPPTCHGNE